MPLALPETPWQERLYAGRCGSYTGSVSLYFQDLRKLLAIWVVLAGAVVSAQEPAKESANTEAKPSEVKPQSEKSAAKGEEKAALPFQITLLETRVRFEANGDSRKEVHTVVKINDAGGARQFARLGFDYNRAFQSVEIPLVRIAHANGGTSEILPSAIGDVPNPAVEKFPAYQDVRVKTVRILGLQEGDTLEYRVITTTTKPPLAPDFWLEHTFDRSGQVLEENYELDLPASPEVHIYISPSAPETPEEHQSETDSSTRRRHVWHRALEKNDTPTVEVKPDVVLTTFDSWEQFARRFAEQMLPTQSDVDKLRSKALDIVKGQEPSINWIRPLYDFVSGKIITVDLPLGATQFRMRAPEEILSSGYATPEDKFLLFAALVKNCCGVRAGLAHSSKALEVGGLPRPQVFDRLLTTAGVPSVVFWMDLNLGVAPFGMIPSQFRGKRALLVGPALEETWREVPDQLPFQGLQKVEVGGAISPDGELKAKVKYVMRGDNELLLRMAFHQAPKDRWSEVAGMLALSDGFRGHIESVKASDPMETEKPFEVEYEITQPKFVDWSKKPVRIPALLPQIALPDAPGKAGGRIELGTPLDVETQMTLTLPEATAVQTPPGTSVERDYATFAAKYDGHLNTVTASRRVKFLLREIPGERAPDYSAFVRAVKLDEAQAIVLFPAGQEEKRK